MSVQVYNHHGDKRLITGMSGTGKTELLFKVLKKEKARLKFVFDHQGEFSRRFGKQPVFDCEGLCYSSAIGGFVVYDPVKMFPGRSQDAFAFFCDFVFAVCERVQGRKIFICDELQKLTSNRDEPQELLAILDTGRRYQLDCFFISQAPNRIHNGVRNQLTQVYTFRQSDANAIKYLEENGFPADQVRNLGKFQYLWRNLENGEQNFDAAASEPGREAVQAERAPGSDSGAGK